MKWIEINKTDGMKTFDAREHLSIRWSWYDTLISYNTITTFKRNKVPKLLLSEHLSDFTSPIFIFSCLLFNTFIHHKSYVNLKVSIHTIKCMHILLHIETHHWTLVSNPYALRGTGSRGWSGWPGPPGISGCFPPCSAGSIGSWPSCRRTGWFHA